MQSRQYRFSAAFLTAGLTAACLILAPGFARAQGVEEGEDLLLRYDPASLTQPFSVVPKTGGADPFTRTLEQFGSVYINDTGFDVFPSIDNDPAYEGRNISQATLTQVAISPGLSAVYAYDSVTPVFGTTSATNFRWTIAETQGAGAAPSQALHSEADDPYYLHQHFTFSTSLTGDYFFDFRYTNIHTFTLDGNGNEVEGITNGVSPIYRIVYRVGGGAAAPEPGAGALLAFGGLLPCAMGIVSRRRRKNG